MLMKKLLLLILIIQALSGITYARKSDEELRREWKKAYDENWKEKLKNVEYTEKLDMRWALRRIGQDPGSIAETPPEKSQFPCSCVFDLKREEPGDPYRAIKYYVSEEGYVFKCKRFDQYDQAKCVDVEYTPNAIKVE